MKRHHVITSIILVLLPVIVIYALTNYGFEKPAAVQKKVEKIETDSGYSCTGKTQQKSLQPPGCG